MLEWLKNVHRKGAAPTPDTEIEPSAQDEFLTPDGYELPDPTPMAPPVGYKKQPSMVEHIRNMVRSEQLRAHVEAQGAESFEEADDFEVDDDDRLPISAYEAFFEPEVPAPPSDGPSATPPAPSSDGSPQGGPAGPTGPAPESPTPAASAAAATGVPAAR